MFLTRFDACWTLTSFKSLMIAKNLETALHRKLNYLICLRMYRLIGKLKYHHKMSHQFPGM